MTGTDSGRGGVFSRFIFEASHIKSHALLPHSSQQQAQRRGQVSVVTKSVVH